MGENPSGLLTTPAHSGNRAEFTRKKGSNFARNSKRANCAALNKKINNIPGDNSHKPGILRKVDDNS
jgi:hypothetical protein